MNRPSAQPPEGDSLRQSASAAVRAHRGKLRVLTVSAFAFALLAIATSLYLVWFWRSVYVPKHDELIRGIDSLQRTAEAAGAGPGDSAMRTSRVLQGISGLLEDEAQRSFAVSFGVAIVALAVSVLGVGMLVLETVVMLSRRVTLNQINSSLEQISRQLRELKNARGS